MGSRRMVACMLRIPQIIPRLHPIASPHRASSWVSLKFPVWSIGTPQTTQIVQRKKCSQSCTSRTFVPGKRDGPGPSRVWIRPGGIFEMDEQNFRKSEEGYIKSPSTAPFRGKTEEPRVEGSANQEGGKFEGRGHAGNAGHLEVASDS